MNAFDPYATLGVGRGASHDEIRAAYRRTSSAAHPDRLGGSHERMTAANQAFAILGDPVKRKRFDTTGRAEDQNVEHEALALLARIVEKALNEAPDDGFVRFIQATAAGARENLRMKREAAIELQRRLVKKIRALKFKGQGENVLAGMLQAKILEMREIVRKCDVEIKVTSRCIRLAESYDPEAPAQSPLEAFAFAMASEMERSGGKRYGTARTF